MCVPKPVPFRCLAPALRCCMCVMFPIFQWKYCRVLLFCDDDDDDDDLLFPLLAIKKLINPNSYKFFHIFQPDLSCSKATKAHTHIFLALSHTVTVNSSIEYFYNVKILMHVSEKQTILIWIRNIMFIHLKLFLLFFFAAFVVAIFCHSFYNFLSDIFVLQLGDAIE